MDEGSTLGMTDGCIDGSSEGVSEGVDVGVSLGTDDGSLEGAVEGLAETLCALGGTSDGHDPNVACGPKAPGAHSFELIFTVLSALPVVITRTMGKLSSSLHTFEGKSSLI